MIDLVSFVTNGENKPRYLNMVPVSCKSTMHRIFKKVTSNYSSEQTRVITLPKTTKKKMDFLTDMQYCHILNKRTGKLTLKEGPARLKRSTGLFFKIHGEIKQKIIVKEDEYAVVMNPVSKERKKQVMGIWELREGPDSFALHPGEELWRGAVQKVRFLKKGQYIVVLNPIEDGKIKFGKRKTVVGKTSYMPLPGEEYGSIRDVHVLGKEEGIYVKALESFTDGAGMDRSAGDEWLVRGPAYYLPPDEVEVTSFEVNEISLSEHSGMYIKNTKTGNIRLERGPKTIMLEPHEKRWNKEFTQSEVEAIWRPAIEEDMKKERGRKFDPMKIISFEPWVAQPLWVLENEAIKIMSQNKEPKIVFGPSVLLLEPYERPFVMTIAGGTPKNTKRLKIWKIKLGPNFSTDVIDVRTSDNAVISITVRYKWRFNVKKNNREDIAKIFSVSDFIGLATETMASRIRDEAAKHTFEELHARSSDILKSAVFGSDSSNVYEFENGFHIFGFDIKKIEPKDSEIARQMNDAITANMKIMVNKVKEEAALEAEKIRTSTQKEIEDAKRGLIEKQNENDRLKKIGDAKSEAESMEIRAKAEAMSIQSKKLAEAEGEVAKIRKIMELVGEGSKDGVLESLLKLQKIDALKTITKIAIVPEGSSNLLNISGLIDE